MYLAQCRLWKPVELTMALLQLFVLLCIDSDDVPMYSGNTERYSTVRHGTGQYGAVHDSIFPAYFIPNSLPNFYFFHFLRRAKRTRYLRSPHWLHDQTGMFYVKTFISCFFFFYRSLREKKVHRVLSYQVDFKSDISLCLSNFPSKFQNKARFKIWMSFTFDLTFVFLNFH